MMADDDYLSDKFLTISEPQKPTTYSEKRKEALRKSLLKDERNKTKSTRHLELESRAEGLSKSLFERAEDEKTSGLGTENKALSMMKKMGFKPGQVLGVPANLDVDERPVPIPTSLTRRDPSPSPETLDIQSQTHEGRLVNPLPLNIWSGTLSLPHAFRWTFSIPSLLRLLTRCRAPIVSIREERHRPRKARAVADRARAPGQGRQGCRRGEQRVVQGSIAPRIRAAPCGEPTGPCPANLRDLGRARGQGGTGLNFFE